MTARNPERGAVLVAALLILALLSLLGAGSLLSASIDTKIVGNQKTARQAFYAAETALDIAVSLILAEFDDPDEPGYNVLIPDGTSVTITTLPGVGGSDLDGFELSYIVENLPELDPGDTPEEEAYTTTENAYPILNYAYNYIVTGRAESTTANDREEVRERIRILRRPVTQYLAFYEGDMNWRPQTGTMTVGGGRVYASGSICLAPATDLAFDANDTWGVPSLTALTAGGWIRCGEEFQENGGHSSGGAADATLAVATGSPVAVPAEVLPDTYALIESDFKRDDDAVLRIGVDPMRSITGDAIGPAGFYAQLAQHALLPAENVDAFYITDAGVEFRYWAGGAPQTLAGADDLVRNYQRSGGQPLDFNNPDAAWPADAIRNADGSSLTTDLIPGTIIYSLESPPPRDHAGTTYLSGEINPDYPARLETTDPREGATVDFTVVDLQRLESWYRSFLIENNVVTPVEFPTRRLLVYATRLGGGNLQAIKLIGSRAGRWRTASKPAGTRQETETALVPTTFVTDRPLYIEGDFATTGANTAVGAPCVLLADAVTLLSNCWGTDHYPDGTPPTNNACTTAASAGFVTGRFGPASGTGTGPAAGVESLVRLMENWGGENLYLNGSLVSLWDSQTAVGDYDDGFFTPPANYYIGWNPQFSDLAPGNDPPYTPSVYLVERESWQEQ